MAYLLASSRGSLLVQETAARSETTKNRVTSRPTILVKIMEAAMGRAKFERYANGGASSAVRHRLSMQLARTAREVAGRDGFLMREGPIFRTSIGGEI